MQLEKRCLEKKKIGKKYMSDARSTIICMIQNWLKDFVIRSLTICLMWSSLQNCDSCCGRISGESWMYRLIASEPKGPKNCTLQGGIVAWSDRQTCSENPLMFCRASGPGRRNSVPVD